MKIEARDLKKSFGRFQALRGVSFCLATGSRTGLVGPNGAGKTTLLRALMGMLKAEGWIGLDGLSALDARRELASQMAYVPQIAPRLSAPVGEVVEAVAKLRGGEVKAVERAASDMGMDLKAAWGKAFAGLSGGTRQRFLIALALAFPARLYVLDEPTAALDPEGRQRFFDLFQRASQGATVFLSSHRMEELKHLVDRAVVLREGRLVFEGPVENLSMGRAGSLIEIRVENLAGAVRLDALGFSCTAGRWWLKAIDLAEKRRLLPLLAPHLGGEFSDLQIRDVERLDLDQGGQDHAAV